jgi:hypothetical protein
MPDTEPQSDVSRSTRTRRSVRQLLFVVAGSHTGAFIGSVVPNSRLGIPGDVFSVVLIAFLFVLPFAVDANWERIYGAYRDVFTDDPLEID